MKKTPTQKLDLSRGGPSRKNLEAMSRPELIYALRSFASPRYFHSLLDWPTDLLRGALADYRKGGTRAEDVRTLEDALRAFGTKLPVVPTRER